MKAFAFTFILILGSLNASCVSAQQLPSDSLGVPLTRQETSYSCGVAAFRSLVKYWTGANVSESSLYTILKTTPAEGTNPKNMANAASGFGMSASWREGVSINDLQAALNKGTTVILDIQAYQDAVPPHQWKDEWESGHYVVLVGLDSNFVYMMDPSNEDGFVYLPQTELIERWHDYENENGKRWENQGLAIFVEGKAPVGAVVPQNRDVTKLE